MDAIKEAAMPAFPGTDGAVLNLLEENLPLLPDETRAVAA
jgi:hypothetical protein